MDVGKSAADDDDRHFCRLCTERLTEHARKRV